MAVRFRVHALCVALWGAALVPAQCVSAGHQWRVITWPGCGAECGASGSGKRDVECVACPAGSACPADPYGDDATSVHALRAVDDALCDASTRPADSDACKSACKYVDPKGGRDEKGRDGASAGAAFATVSACIEAWKGEDAAGATGSSPRVVRKCKLMGGTYQEPTVAFSDVAELSIEAVDGKIATFDATDAVDGLKWSTSDDAVYTASLRASSMESVLVDGEQATCDPTVKGLCLVWDPAASWARRYSGKVADLSAKTSWWHWADGTLHVHRAARKEATGLTSWPPAVRVKNAGRAVAIAIKGSDTRGVQVKGIQFRASSVRLAMENNKRGPRLAVSGCRFLYAQQGQPAAALTSYEGSRRGAGGRVWLTNNTFEFGEGGATNSMATTGFVKGAGAVVRDNYLAFNSFAARSWLLLAGWSEGEHVTHNTGLYNADYTFYKPASDAPVLSDNLVVALNWLGEWHDTAYFHLQIRPQTEAVVQRNWLLGPSVIKPIRLDTAKTTEYDQSGRNSRIAHNVWMSGGFPSATTTIKGDNHTVVHNTGEFLDVVWGWGAIDEMNRYTVTEYNAVPGTDSRGSAKGGLPGRSRLNTCSKLDACSPGAQASGLGAAGWEAAPPTMGAQLSAVANVDALCALLRACWKSEGVGADALPQKPPYAWDFRPAKANDTTLTFSNPSPGYDAYLGAYQHGDKGTMPGRRDTAGAALNAVPPPFALDAAGDKDPFPASTLGGGDSSGANLGIHTPTWGLGLVAALPLLHAQ